LTSVIARSATFSVVTAASPSFSVATAASDSFAVAIAPSGTVRAVKLYAVDVSSTRGDISGASGPTLTPSQYVSSNGSSNGTVLPRSTLKSPVSTGTTCVSSHKTSPAVTAL